MPAFEIVASAENNHYMEWQAMLFHYSCQKTQRQTPIIAVHKGDEPLLPGFEMISANGGHVQPVPNLRNHRGVLYPPRNTAVALQAVDTAADYIILCDADMVFLQPLPLKSVQIDSDTISFDRVGYLHPDHPVYQPDIDNVFRSSGIDPTRLRNPVIDGGVPHVVPKQLQKSLAKEWRRCIDVFPILFEGERPDSSDERYNDWPMRCYLASMWAIIMAKHRLNLNHVETRWSMNNYNDDQPMPDPGSEIFLLHYCYGSPAFDKRHLADDNDVRCIAFRNLAPDDGTVAGFLRKILREAAQFYGLC
ncbi:MAG: hypothetical protein RIK87_30825 [Fuerstiella sp.]